ncbi:unnamed protein product [Ambrosiozyma monospora]|uniref:Unnamed protein product n=1 Tax=Ambrosiozyma monospora TaxID=43982 RepID=A0ACB5TPV9_AMBMO|nr:unnamed protein product [Ambrosiozyma monospora]
MLDVLLPNQALQQELYPVTIVDRYSKSVLILMTSMVEEPGLMLPSDNKHKHLRNHSDDDLLNDDRRDYSRYDDDLMNDNREYRDTRSRNCRHTNNSNSLLQRVGKPPVSTFSRAPTESPPASPGSTSSSSVENRYGTQPTSLTDSNYQRAKKVRYRLPLPKQRILYPLPASVPKNAPYRGLPWCTLCGIFHERTEHPITNTCPYYKSGYFDKYYYSLRYFKPVAYRQFFLTVSEKKKLAAKGEYPDNVDFNDDGEYIPERYIIRE